MIPLWRRKVLNRREAIKAAIGAVAVNDLGGFVIPEPFATQIETMPTNGWQRWNKELGQWEKCDNPLIYGDGSEPPQGIIQGDA